VQTFKYLNGEKGIYFCFIPLIVLLLFFVVKATGLGYADFASYYFGSQLLLSGDYLTAYDTASLNLSISDQGFRNLFVSYTPFPPFTAVFFYPFTLLSIESSKIIFNCISCTSFIFTVYRSFKYFEVPSIYLLLVPLLFFIPIQNNLFFGQTYLILFCLLMEGYMAYRKGQVISSSVLWGIAILLKIFPVLLFFFLLAKKEYKNVFFLACICSALLIFSTFINGFNSWHFYITEIFPRLNNGELNDSYTYIFQSAFMLLKNVFIYDEVLNTQVIYNSPSLFWISLAVFKACVFGVCVMVSLKENTNQFLGFAFWIMASILISPNGSTYSLILLLIPLMTLYGSVIPKRTQLILMLLLWLICNLALYNFASLSLFFKFPRLYLLIAFFIMMTVIAKTKLNLKIVLGFILIFLLQDSSRLIIKPDNSSYFFKEDKYFLIYDYKIKDNKLICSYWSIVGSKKDSVDFTGKESVTVSLCVKENQIYYSGKKMTDSPDWKKKPVLVDNRYIIYLSDKNKGIGFYTLRKITLAVAI
jgi:hypothetical protein